MEHSSVSPITTSLEQFCDVSIKSVVRVVVRGQSVGTGFWHKSGNVITAAHVVTNANPKEIQVIDVHGQACSVAESIFDPIIDIAVLRIGIDATQYSPLNISQNTNYRLGRQIFTLGFPVGHNDSRALLSVGYFAGIFRESFNIQNTQTGEVKNIFLNRLTINCAVNSGNSGGPLIDGHTGGIIGIIRAKNAPLPQDMVNDLKVMVQRDSGAKIKCIRGKNRLVEMSRSEIILRTVQFLHSQIQLVIGHSVSAGNIIAFLGKIGLEVND